MAALAATMVRGGSDGAGILLKRYLVAVTNLLAFAHMYDKHILM